MSRSLRGCASWQASFRALALFLLAASAWSGSATAQQAGRCWSEADLRAAAEERLIRRQSAAEARHPSVAAPSPKPVPAHLRGSVRRVKLPPGRKLVALTFDLCETYGEKAGYDGAIVEFLRAHRVRTTFFAGGKWLMSHPARAQQLMADPLFEIASHGWSHKNLRVLTGSPMLEEIRLAGAAYAETRAALAARGCPIAAIPEGPRLFRFPYGVCSPESLAAAAEAGMVSVQWDVVTADPWRGLSAEAMARIVLRMTRPGSIIVAHANGRGWNTAAALPLIVPALRAEGYEFVTVSELLAAGEPEIVADCYELRPGDNKRYDLAARPKASPAEKPKPPSALSPWGQ